MGGPTLINVWEAQIRLNGSYMDIKFAKRWRADGGSWRHSDKYDQNILMHALFSKN